MKSSICVSGWRIGALFQKVSREQCPADYVDFIFFFFKVKSQQFVLTLAHGGPGIGKNYKQHKLALLNNRAKRERYRAEKKTDEVVNLRTCKCVCKGPVLSRYPLR